MPALPPNQPPDLSPITPALAGVIRHGLTYLAGVFGAGSALTSDSIAQAAFTLASVILFGVGLWMSRANGLRTPPTDPKA